MPGSRLLCCIALVLVVAGCELYCVVPAPQAPPQDAGDASDPAALACGKLAGWGCPVGRDPHCGDVFRLPPSFGLDPWAVLEAGVPDALPPTVRCGP